MFASCITEPKWRCVGEREHREENDCFEVEASGVLFERKMGMSQLHDDLSCMRTCKLIHFFGRSHNHAQNLR
jgi:hypothetical protein